MKLFDLIPHSFEDKKYEIRIYYDEQAIVVAAFQGGHPANGYRFQVKIPKRCDAKEILEKFPVPDLVGLCRKQIQDKTWDALSQVIGESMLK